MPGAINPTMLPAIRDAFIPEITTMRAHLTLLIPMLITAPTLGVERQPWLTSRVTGSPGPAKDYRIERAFPDLQFDRPVELMPLPGTGRMLLMEVSGKVYTFAVNDDSVTADLAIDLRPQNEDMSQALGIAPHPRFPSVPEIFVVYSAKPSARANGSRLSRFRVTTMDPPTVDPNSEEILITWHSGGHNGSAIRFDSKGLLYFSTGDGARPFPPDEFDVSQDLSDLRANICRIDIDRRDEGMAYAIPPDNPFVDLQDARPEIWAYGFRNPWRFSIDPITDRMMVGDVGWELWELVHHVEKGSNHGWSIVEGPQPIRSDIAQGPTPIRKPVVAYPHTEGMSVTGGFTYRGNALPNLKGAYLYGDYVTGKIWGLRFDAQGATWNEVIAESGIPVITFSETPDREVMVVSYGGTIHRLVRNEDAGKPSDFPVRLSETGLFSSVRKLTPSPGVYEYQLTAMASARGATSQLHLAIPGNGTIQSVRRRRSWQFPNDSVFVKTISHQRIDQGGEPSNARIETQLLHYDGSSWNPYTYQWNDAQTDATLVSAAGKTQPIEIINAKGNRETIDWQFQNRSQCLACHSSQNGGPVGFDYANLNEGEQIQILVSMKILDKPAPKGWNIRSLVNPLDSSNSLDDRARSFLTVNCSQCHRRGGGGTVALDLSYDLKNDAINAIDYPVTQGTFGIEDARVIVPGAPYRSILFYRMATSGVGHMPKLWPGDNDSRGLKLIHDWIDSMDDDAKAHSANKGVTEMLRRYAWRDAVVL